MTTDHFSSVDKQVSPHHCIREPLIIEWRCLALLTRNAATKDIISIDQNTSNDSESGG